MKFENPEAVGAASTNELNREQNQPVGVAEVSAR